MEIFKSEQRAYFNFDTFSQQKEYQDVNLKFIERTFPIEWVFSGDELTVLDVACGTGLITSILLNKVNGRKCKIIGIDPNFASLEIAKNKVKSFGETKVEFYECIAQDIPNFIPLESVDIAYFCNAIHEIPTDSGKQESLNAISKVLKPGGKLFMNSTFTKESYTPDTVKFWGMLKLIAFQSLGNKRSKESTQFEILSIDDYKRKLINADFNVIEVNSVRVELSESAMLAICKYDAFIEGVFIDMEDTENFTLEQKSGALELAVKTILSQVKGKTPGFNPFARNWIEFSCERP